MSIQKKKLLPADAAKKTQLKTSREVLQKIIPLSGSAALNSILNHDNPAALVRDMSRVDLFWLVKSIGEDDSLPLLQLATDEQWQYFIDMEIWKRDLIDLEKSFVWINRLYRADPQRLSRWMYSEEGNLYAHFYFFKTIEVKIREDDDFSPPQGYITFDNLYFVRIVDREHEEEIEQILRSIALEDHIRYQSLMLGLAGVIPSEIEEELYRQKGVRLSEIGYLPYEEAISVYAYQKPDQLKMDSSEYKLYYPEEDDIPGLIPVTPLIIYRDSNLFTLSASRINDYNVLERLRLEFAGLCNQILSADNVEFEDIDILRRVAAKTAGYINIGLEELSKGEIEIAEKYIRNHPLISLFRTGFSLALELKWKYERWIKEAWFRDQELNSSFWGDQWGGMLEGLSRKKPLYYDPDRGENNLRDFETITEIRDLEITLRRIILLDQVLEKISSHYFRISDFSTDPTLNFYPIIFTCWARKLLLKKPGFAPLSQKEAADFFDLVRDENREPPYTMTEYEKIFTGDMTSLVNPAEKEDLNLLYETLAILWKEFSREYGMVRTQDLNARFSRFILMS